MEIVVREVTIRGEKYFIVDAKGVTQERQLKLLLDAAYNSIITDPEFAERLSQNPKTTEALENLKHAIEDFQDLTDIKNYRKTG